MVRGGALISILLVGTFAVTSLIADDDLEKQLAEAKLRQQIAEAQAAEIKARYAVDLSQAQKPVVEGLDKMQIEPVLLTYVAARNGANEIADAVAAAKPASVIIMDSATAEALATYRGYVAEMQKLLERGRSLAGAKPPAEVPCPAVSQPPQNKNRQEFMVSPEIAPAPLVSAAVALISLLKSDVAFTGASVKPENDAVEALVAERLRAQGVHVVVARLFRPAADVKSGFAETLNQLIELRTDVDRTLEKTDFDISSAAARLETAPEKEKCSIRRRIEADRKYQDRLQRVSQQIGNVLTAYETPDMQTAKNVGALIRSSQLETAFPQAHLLTLSCVAGGASSRTRTNIFAAKTTFSGGTVISYMLTAPGGEVATAGVSSQYGPRVRDIDFGQKLFNEASRSVQRAP